MATTVAAGAVSLLEAAKCGDDVLKAGVVQTIIRESAVAESIPWMSIQGNALKHQEETSLPTLQFRDVNETYDRSFGTDIEHYWGTAILGGEVYTDNYIVRVRGNVTDVRRKQYTKVSKAAALTLDKYVIDGTGTAKDFKGFNALIDEGWGQGMVVGDTAAQTVPLSASTGTAGALSLDDFDVAYDLMRFGPPDFMLCNRFHRRKITKLGRTGATYFSQLDVGTDSFGRRVMSWNDVPLRIVGDDVNGSQILAFDESIGSGHGNATSSIYFVRANEDTGACGLLGVGGHFEVVDFGEQQASPGYMGRIEFYPGVAVFSKQSLVRIAGIKQV